MTPPMTLDDLRAAVAAGILDKAQAARLTALATDRAGQRAAMPHEDEPFEFFRGFAEIFISIGLIILLTGVAMALAGFGSEGFLMWVPLVASGIAWWWAEYFTLKRRMILPSIVLASAFGAGICSFAFILLDLADTSERVTAIATFLIPTFGMLPWYRRFRLPFAAFLTGLFTLGAIYAFTAATANVEALAFGGEGLDNLFNLQESPAFATATLVFGIGMFVAGMWFDLRDPHRLGRYSATAFWCHLLAALALVNTVAITLLGANGGGMLLLSLALLIITLLALVIDRRSFLTAAIVYIAVVIAWFAGDSDSFGSWVFIVLALGTLITAIGTWWVQLRAAVMAALPNFPGKSRLPPYTSTE